MEGPMNDNVVTEQVQSSPIQNQFDTAVPSKISTWTKIKNFLFQEITIELTPKQEATFKAIDDFLTTAVYNQSIKEPTSKMIDNYIQPIRQLISKLYIAGNTVGAVRDTIQGLFENIARSVNKYQKDHKTL